jgi:hypothetical protein
MDGRLMSNILDDPTEGYTTEQYLRQILSQLKKLEHHLRIITDEKIYDEELD